MGEAVDWKVSGWQKGNGRNAERADKNIQLRQVFFRDKHFQNQTAEQAQEAADNSDD